MRACRSASPPAAQATSTPSATNTALQAPHALLRQLADGFAGHAAAAQGSKAHRSAHAPAPSPAEVPALTTACKLTDRSHACLFERGAHPHRFVLVWAPSGVHARHGGTRRMQATRMQAQSTSQAKQCTSKARGAGAAVAGAAAAARTGRVHVQAQLHALRAVVAHRARHQVLARPAGRHLQPQRRHVGLPGRQAARAEVARRLTLHPHVVELCVVREHLRARGGPSAPGAGGAGRRCQPLRVQKGRALRQCVLWTLTCRPQALAGRPCSSQRRARAGRAASRSELRLGVSAHRQAPGHRGCPLKQQNWQFARGR